MIRTIWAWLKRIGLLFERGWKGLWASVGYVETSELLDQKQKTEPAEEMFFRDICERGKSRTM